MTVTELANVRAAEQPADAGRWRPTRAGIVNIWRYYDETFEFHSGRLLLRGPNGTGKSKALELLLPYLFDANLRPHRLSTFGSSDRTMHWNLMGEGNQGSTRVGYVWLEFDRVIDGATEWFSCGARLQATTNTKNVQSSYFTTSQRIGPHGRLSLVNDAGRPLVRADLAAAIGDAGEVHTSAAEYRRTVRQTLFPGVSEQRYDALITALLQLRTPKLSERLDPAVLSALLSRALPPLDHADIAEIAEGFERLDRQREELRQLDEDVTVAETVAGRQRTYAQRVLRAAAASLIGATSTMTELTRKARTSKEECDKANRDLREVTSKDTALRSEAGNTEARIEGIMQLPAYREGSQLDQLRRDVAAARDRAESAGRTAAKLRKQANRVAVEAEQTAHAAKVANEAMIRTAVEARQAGDRAGMATVYEEIDATGELRSSRRLLRAAVDSRSGQIEKVRQALDKHKRSIDERDDAAAQLESAREKLAEAEGRAATARQEYEAALATLAEQLLGWARGCAQLAVPDPEDLAELVADRGAVDELVHSAASAARERFAREETGWRNARETLVAEQARHEAERDTLRNRVDRLPPAPHTRTASRDSVDGAPLWRLLDFRADVPERRRAAVEAGLEAAGLLDAWVLPDGMMTAADEDTFAEALLTSPAPGRSLAELLVVEPDAQVPAERVGTLLAGIAFAETAPDHQAAVGEDGTWRLASTHGRWSKPEAEYIGARARERARERRIAELTGLIQELTERIDSIDEQLESIAEQRARLAEDLARRPGYSQVDDAEDEYSKATQLRAVLADSVETARQALEGKEKEVAAALRTLTSVGSEHGLPTSAEGLDSVQTAVKAFHDTGQQWLDDRQDALTKRETSRETADRADGAAENAAEAEDTAGSRATEANELATKLATVEESVGGEYRELADELTRHRSRLTEIDHEREALRGKESDLRHRIGKLEERHSDDQSKMEEATTDRDTAEHRFRALSVGPLLDDARVGLELGTMESKRSTLDAARRLAERLSSVPHEQRNIRDAEARLAEAVHDAQQALSGRADLAMEPADAADDVRLFRATVEGVRHGAAALLDLLRADRTRMAEQITAGERELFDRPVTHGGSSPSGSGWRTSSSTR